MGSNTDNAESLKDQFIWSHLAPNTRKKESLLILLYLLMGCFSPIPVYPLMHCLCEPLFISNYTIYSLPDFVFTRNLMPPSMSSKRNGINKMTGFRVHGRWLRFWNSKSCSLLYIRYFVAGNLNCSCSTLLTGW